MTREEILKKIDSLEKENEACKIEASKYNSLQLAYKLVMNGSYGAFASKMFILFNRYVADSITAQGRELTKTMVEYNNHYWNNEFHLDEELHQKMNLRNVKKINTDDVSLYADTDSLFVCFEHAYKNCEHDYTGERELDFVVEMDKYRIGPYFTKVLEDYAASYGVVNKHNFELEKIFSTLINVRKKNYIADIIYEDGVRHKKGTYLYIRGLAIKRKTTPKFTKERALKIVDYIFENKHDLKMRKIVELIKSYKQEFKMLYPNNIDDMSLRIKCSNYEEHILEDKTELKYVKGTAFGVKAAGLHNLYLNKNKIYQDKYDFIKSGDSIKYYVVEDDKSDEDVIFGYMQGYFPIEIAPKMDFDKQFFKAFINIINPIIRTAGLSELNEKLSYKSDIFSDFGLL